jgi:hypothetical protein
MQEGIKDGRLLRPGGLVFYRGPDARSHLKLQNIQASVNKDDCSGGRGGMGGGWEGGNHSDTRKELAFQNSHKTMLDRIIFLWTSSIPDCRKFEKRQSL